MRSLEGAPAWEPRIPSPSAAAPASTAAALVAADPRPRGGGAKLRDLVLLAAAVAAHVGDGARGVGRGIRSGGFGDCRFGDGCSRRRRRVFVLVGVVCPVRRVVVDVLEVVHLVVGEYVADGVVLGGFLVVGRVGGCLVGFLGEGLFLRTRRLPSFDSGSMLLRSISVASVAASAANASPSCSSSSRSSPSRSLSWSWSSSSSPPASSATRSR